MILHKRYFALTTDLWISVANHGNTTCTAHFIDKETWQLHLLVLGIFEKDGPSTANDTVAYVEQQMSLFDLAYKGMVAVVTDTEATMISAGRKFVENSARNGGASKWHGCMDHILELVTGIAFKDLAESEGTMKACRALISFFHFFLTGHGKASWKAEYWEGFKAHPRCCNLLVEHMVQLQSAVVPEELSCFDGGGR
jgi:hypothetical protein